MLEKERKFSLTAALTRHVGGRLAFLGKHRENVNTSYLWTVHLSG